MSDFWEKNKGSITAGLKKTGKAGLNGTRYVAKTGYEAGKKNWGSNKNKSGKKHNEEEDLDDDLDEHTSHGRSYRSHQVDPSYLPPPPSRTNPSQRVAAQHAPMQGQTHQTYGHQREYQYPDEMQPQNTSNSQVHPYDLTAPYLKKRFEMSPVNLTNLPPPPIHRDRSSPPRTRESSPRRTRESSPESRSSFPPPPPPRSRSRQTSPVRQNSPPGQTPHGRLPGSRPPPPVKPKPRSLQVASGPPASKSSTPAAAVDSISQELSRVQLKNRNSKYIEGPTSSKLPLAPPNKNDHLRASTDQQDINPFEHYLKSAVPAENDRLHKPM